MWYFSYLALFEPVFSLFPPLRSLVPGYVIKDAVEENYESDHDSWLLTREDKGDREGILHTHPIP